MGVFFLHVKQSQSLSVTLLRKLLKGLVKKKRTTPSSSQSKRWNLEDLLFICTLDKDDVSTQYFAHFKENKKISPKLMIGSKWQTSQPMEEIRKAKSTLSDNLKWPMIPLILRNGEMIGLLILNTKKLSVHPLCWLSRWHDMLLTLNKPFLSLRSRK